VVTTFWACLTATKALEDILPHAVVIHRAQTAATDLRVALEQVGRGKAQNRKINSLSPRFCEGQIEMRKVSIEHSPFFWVELTLVDLICVPCEARQTRDQ
jgi:hypothetical protein